MADTANSGDRGRSSAKRRTEAMLRPVRGENLKFLARELALTASLSG
jgi:hypothetical protein